MMEMRVREKKTSIDRIVVSITLEEATSRREGLDDATMYALVARLS